MQVWHGGFASKRRSHIFVRGSIFQLNNMDRLEKTMSEDQTQLPHSLLIVDDSKVSRMRIRAFFTAHCPAWTFREAGSGDEAIGMAANDPPHFVTMDVNMPGMSGFETAQLMLLRNPEIRIVMLTANIQEGSRQMAASMQIKFVAKPATEASLQQALDHLLAPQ
jgi:two-component system chemotaxis response regulator CheY